MATMMLGGIWHGASWTFLLWGSLHGFYLMINHAWRGIARDRFRKLHPIVRWISRAMAWSLTFCSVVIAWVFFRAETLAAALNVLEGMLGMGSRLAFPSHMFPVAGLLFGYLFVVLCLPNTQQLMRQIETAISTVRSGQQEAVLPTICLMWRSTTAWAVVSGAIAAYAFMSISQPSEFLYFQF